VIDQQQNLPILDWRELQRWHVDERRLPADSRVLYRVPPIWPTYKTEIIGGALVVVLQGLLILALLISKRDQRSEHRQRQRAESVTRNLEQRVTRFSKERSLGVMATTIAHEVNQPLIAIQNYSQAAARRMELGEGPSEKISELLQKIEQQAGRAGNIIQHIRSLVGSSDPELEPVRLITIVEQVVQLMELEIADTGTTIVIDVDRALPQVLADALQIQLVLVNLLKNALNGVSAQWQRGEGRIRLDAHLEANGEIKVAVADSGPGISPEKLASLFSPFSSGGGDGMGLGLNICQSIIEAHGGRIWYSPSPFGGAMFEFTLRSVP
jgi:C4-dicarboxylate-specific signal transduction histidine kinase